MKGCASIAVFGVITLLAPPAGSDDLEDIRSLLITAKFAGACGILSQMATFQESTKMPGGDAMMERFWTTEAARLGWSFKTFVDNCRQSIDSYEQFMATVDSDLESPKP